VPTRRPYARPSNAYRASPLGAGLPADVRLTALHFRSVRHCTYDFHRTSPHGLVVAAQAGSAEGPVLRPDALVSSVSVPCVRVREGLFQLRHVSPSVLHPCRARPAPRDRRGVPPAWPAPGAGSGGLNREPGHGAGKIRCSVAGARQWLSTASFYSTASFDPAATGFRWPEIARFLRERVAGPVPDVDVKGSVNQYTPKSPRSR
jgi:hypothetical protein